MNEQAPETGPTDGLPAAVFPWDIHPALTEDRLQTCALPNPASHNARMEA